MYVKGVKMPEASTCHQSYLHSVGLIELHLFNALTYIVLCVGLLAFTVGAGDHAKGILSDATPHLWKVARAGPSIAARSSVSV